MFKIWGWEGGLYDPSPSGLVCDPSLKKQKTNKTKRRKGEET
jgi:hypothetical protein